MEHYIETKLFTNLRQRLKRNNPKYELSKVKLHSTALSRPQTSRVQKQKTVKDFCPLILMSSNPGSTKKKKFGNRVSTGTTRPQTSSSNLYKAQDNQKSHIRAKSAVGSRLHLKRRSQDTPTSKSGTGIINIVSPTSQTFTSQNSAAPGLKSNLLQFITYRF